MKFKIYISYLLFVLIPVFINAQVGINTNNPQATLEVSHTSNSITPSGIIAPRVSLNYLVENDGLYKTEQKGTIVYVEDLLLSEDNGITSSTVDINSNGYYYFDGIKWSNFVSFPNLSQLISNQTWIDQYTGEEAINTNDSIIHSGMVGIGISDKINKSAQLEVRSSNKGILIPRLTTEERNLINSPANSLLIFNIDTQCFNFYNNKNKWKTICGDIGDADIFIFSCDLITNKGDYIVGKPTNSGNYLEMPIKVIEPGNYHILINNQDSGFFFEKTGTFPNSGDYTLLIPSIGTPLISGINEFDITINNNVYNDCKVSIDVDNPEVKITTITVSSSDDLTKNKPSNGKMITLDVISSESGISNFTTSTIDGVNYTALNVSILGGNASQEVKMYSNGASPSEAGTLNFDILATGYQGTVTAPVNVLDVLANITSIDCDNTSVNGIYKLNTPFTSMNYIDIPVTTSNAGSYSINAINSDNPNFTFEGSGYIQSAGQNTIRAYAKGNINKTGKMLFTVTINGSNGSTNCTILVPVLLEPKPILLAGSYFVGIKQALNDPANFGPNGKSKIENIGYANTNIIGGSVSAADLKDYINNKGVQIIIIGWGWKPTTEVNQILRDFVINKKGFVYWIEGQGEQVPMKQFIDLTFGGNITMTNDVWGTGTGPIENMIPDNPELVSVYGNNNPFTNGVFGNVVGKYMRSDDNSSWMGAVPSTLPSNMGYLIAFPSHKGGSGTGTNSPRLTQLFGKGFLTFSDWGFLNKQSQGDFGTPTPIGYNTITYDNWQFDGNSVFYGPLLPGNIANWIVFGNAMDYIFHYVNENYDPNYQVQ